MGRSFSRRLEEIIGGKFGCDLPGFPRLRCERDHFLFLRFKSFGGEVFFFCGSQLVLKRAYSITYAKIPQQ